LPALGLLASKPLPAQSGPPLNIQPSGTNEVQITWPPGTNFNVLEEALGLEGTNGWVDVPDAPSPLGVLYAVRAATTNGATFYRLAQRGTPGVATPPDPATVAPALSPNVFNTFGASTAFLYTGPNPIQIGVAPGTIQAVQAAVLRGTVRGRDNTPLPGVRVALLNHPEFGYTYTRTNGMFDMAVNASQYTVDFEAIGYLQVQRQAQLTGQSYLTLPDVMMIGLDPMSTVVTLGSNAPLQVAPSTPQTDAAGTRSATLFLPAGTTATMVLPDGSTQAMSTLTVRVTEYTVGSNGPATMPAALPPNSGYTYCAEFAADEELAVGATTVIFSQPLPVYVDNFLNVPVGTLVPVGNYNRTMAAWMPMSNGIVMQMLGSANGIALVDLHGTGQPEPTNVLAANGFTTQELEQLASLFPAGKTLWRCSVPHFASPYDMNFMINPPNSQRPSPGEQPQGDPGDNSADNDGTLNFSTQTFAEAIPLVGVPFDLHYNSARVPDYRVLSEVMVPVTYMPPPQIGNCKDLPTGISCQLPVQNTPSNIRVDLDIFGEDTYQILPETNTWATVSWGGRDPYGRLVGGSGQATITVAYEWTNWNYGGVLGGPELSREFPELFGNDGNETSFEGHTGTTLAVGETFQQILTDPDHRALGFGGWSPTVLHRLDPVAGILYYGDGRIRTLPLPSIQGPFLSQINVLQRVVAAAPDGSIYYDGSLIDQSSENFIFRRLPDGTFQIITASLGAPGVVYPNGSDWSKVDGQSVTNVSLSGVDLVAMCVGPDGSVYVTDTSAIARLTPDGIWHVILGLNVSSPATLQPDGTPAQNSAMTSAGRVTMAVGPDSSVYFTTFWGPINGTNYSMIRKVAPNGNLYTVFGAPGALAATGGPPWNTLYGSSAFSAPYGGGPIEAIAVGGDGTVYVSPGEFGDGGGMFQISTGGVILPFLTAGPETGAGAGYNPSDTNDAALIQGDEGRLATEVTSGADATQTIAVGPDGSVYFTPDTFIVWRVNPNGILQRVAGRYGNTNYSAPNFPIDGADPLNTYMYPVEALAVTPSDTLAEATTELPPYVLLYPGRSSQQGLLAPIETQNIPSEDGSEVYVFDQNGRHLSTLDSLTGAAKWTFGYDTDSLVVTMTDLAGNVTQIQRNGAGQPTAIIGPYGQTTTLGLDANGFLNKVSNPANETTSMNSTSGGLLSSITGPLGDTYRVSYDSLGRVTQVSDPLGGGWTDTVTNLTFLGTGYAGVDVDCTNSVGDTLYRQLILLPNGNTTATYYSGSNTTGQSILELNGNEWDNFFNGSTFYVGVGADPRFGSQVIVPTLVISQLPSNIVNTVSIQRSAGLAINGDPLSVTGLTNVTTVNGNSYTSIYTASNLTTVTTSPAGRSSQTVLDSLGRLRLHQDPGAPAVGLAYDGQGRMISSTNIISIGLRQTTVSYNAFGQVSNFTDALGQSTSFTYDAAGRMSSLTSPDGSTTGYTHDSEYQLTSVTPPGRPAHTFQRNAVGLLAKYTPPLVGSDDSVGYQYDTERNLTQVNFPDGQVMSFQRGQAGRIDAVTVGAGPTLTYQYGQQAGSGFFLVTNISSTTGDAFQLGYTGSLITSLGWTGTVTGNVAVQLGSDLLPVAKSVNGSAVNYAYDNDRLLTQAGNMSITRDAARGGIKATALGAVTDQREFDDRGLLTNYVASVNGTAIWSLSLSHDLVDRLTNKVETIGGQTQTFRYVYDLGGRLQQVWLNGAVSVTYTYDINGNRLTRNTETATYDAQDRVLTYAGANYTWSPNGSLLSASDGGQTSTYTYDVRGALTTVSLPDGTQVSYLVDPNGHRIGKSVGGALQRGWLWDGLVPVAEVDSSSAVNARFVYGEGTTPTFMISGANTYRILSDERGSVRLVVNVADGAIAEQLDYDEFGRVLSDTAPGFQPFGFAGGLYDPDTGLVRFGLRDYSPQTGQWTARDPLTFAGGETSLYAYVLNDPVNLNDLTGTGPFGLKTRWGATTALDGALFQGGNPKGGNDGQLQAALDGANNQVKGALTTGAGLTAGGAVAYVAGATALLASTVAPLAATSTAGSGFASVAPAASTAAAQVAGVDAATTGAATAAPALEAAPAAVAPTASSASAAGADAAATQAAAAAPAAAAATPTAAAAAAPGAAAAPAAAAPSAAPFIPLDPLLSQWL
jgi:RHS repeat-associated protein